MMMMMIGSILDNIVFLIVDNIFIVGNLLFYNRVSCYGESWR